VTIKKELACKLNVAIPGHRNVIKKEVEKILKYEDLVIEIQRKWNVKAKVTQVRSNKGDWNHRPDNT